MPRNIKRVVLWCALSALVIAVEGCKRGPTWNLAAVEGTVTKDGRPLANIQVTFLPDAGSEGPKAMGFTDESGHYRLRNDNGGDGAVVGNHRVLLYKHNKPVSRGIGGRDDLFLPPQVKKAARLPPDDTKKPKKQAEVPPSYGKFNETPLRVEVHPGLQTLDFNIP